MGQVLSTRRLAFEALERRDLLAVMRIVNWNTENNPDDSTEDAYFSTVFQAIGNETIQGNTKNIDILALQETDPPGVGQSSIERVESVLNGLYPSTNYDFVVTVGGTDSTGIVYDTATVSLLESLQVGAGSLTHTTMRAKFRPVSTLGESDFYVYSVHLKSGDGGPDATTRGVEANLLRADADALGEGAFVIMLGDFNMLGSSEVAYTNLVASGAGQLFDVADAPGEWRDNPAFKNLHSQDPDPKNQPTDHQMDDRFDIQFASGEFLNNIGLEYVHDSYHVFGNNGTHTLDDAITTGTGASPAVLSALVAASDHLPVVADYEILVSTPNVRITETSGGTKVIEGGLYDTYSVVLDTIPSANVTVTVTPDTDPDGLDVGDGAGGDIVLTFTPANALTPQTVIVNAVNDATGEGTETKVITHTSASADPSYNGLTIASVTATIIDNDAPTIVINEIDSDTDSIDMLEFVELYDGGVGNFLLTGYTAVFFNGGIANDPFYASFDLTGKTTNADGFFVLGNSSVSPTPGMLFDDDTLQNGADAVALYYGLVGSIPGGAGPTHAHFSGKLKDAIVYDTNDADDAALIAALTPGQPQVNEDAANDKDNDSLSRVPDNGTPLITSTYVPRLPTPGTFNQVQAHGVAIVHSGSRVDVEEGGVTDSYQIALVSIPTDDVLITVDPDGQTNLGAGAGVAIVLTFTPANALIPQTVNVTAVDDLAIEGVHTSTITHTAESDDTAYDGIAIGNVVANIVDNDIAAPTSIVISEIMYNPASDETSPGVAEWIEIINAGTTAVDLSGWLFDDEDGTNWGAIPGSTVLNPNQIAVFFDTAFTDASTFRTQWSVPTGALVVGISWGSLANSPSPTNEILQLRNNVSEQMDLANFDDTTPWPAGANGPSIYLKDLSADNNVGSNWARSVSGIAYAISPAGAPFSTSDVGSPGKFFLAGDYNLSGGVDTADYVVWRQLNGSSNPIADHTGTTPGVPDGVVNDLDYNYWRANFGGVGVPNGGAGGGGEEERGATLRVPGEERVAASKSTTMNNVDVAVADFGSLPSMAESSTPSPSMRRSSTASTAKVVDSLLLVDLASPTAESADEEFGTHAESSDAGFDDIDLYFDSLGEASLLATLLAE
jgi:endonuclease/exonuclease/phosphatase family metal-dependent hydrolase